MLKNVPVFFLVPLSMLILATNTLFWALWLYVMLALKIILPTKALKRQLTERMTGFGENWISVNSFLMTSLQGVSWHIEGLGDLRRDRSYLICANHQSWVDILVLQKLFNRRVPFLRFFLKQELLYVPVLGGVWWALDFPFMKRYSKEYLAKYPEKRGHDLKTTRKACEHFKGAPISVLNFFEGTRYTEEKSRKQGKPFQNLLAPKAGGAAFVIESMGEQFDALLDVTIYYPGGAPSMWDLFCGRFREARIFVQQIQIPPEFLVGEYLEDSNYRDRFQEWVRKIWEEKDHRLTRMKAKSS